MRLGDNKEVQVEGRGTVALNTHERKVKLLYDEQFVPKLAHNLFNKGQFIASRYSVLLENDTCIIRDGSTGV